MEKLEDLYLKLEKYKNFEENDNDEKFLEIADKIVEFHDPKSLPVLLKHFDDEDSSWVLETLAGMIIDYLDNENYTKSILQNISVFLPKAQNCFLEFIFPILSDTNCLEIFKKNLYLAPKKDLEFLLDKIYEESPMHRRIVDELRTILERQK